MKKIGLFLTMMLGVAMLTFAQTFPQGMNYQAVMRDLDGQVLANQELGIKISLLGGNADGKVVYSEVHQVNTNQFGLINLLIGKGEILEGDMLEVPWASEEIWMDIAIGNDDKTYTSINTTRLLAVPYAFHALSADKINSLADNEKWTSPYWKTVGNTGVTIYDFLGTKDFSNLVFKTNNIQRMTILANGNVEMAYDLFVDGTVAAGAFIGDGSGLTGIDVNDADHDPTNELQDWSNLPGIPADLLDGDDFRDADYDPTNELQKWSNLPGIPPDLLDGDDVDDADHDPTNELELPGGGTPGQVLSIAPNGKYYWRDIEPTYSIGYNAELGGYVFYVTPNGKHGLVAAMQDQAINSSWLKCQDEISNPGNHDTDGKRFTNWRLPTKYELNLMFPYRYALGMTENYWCSTEQNYFDAWYQNFWYGYPGYTSKNTSYYVRAVRDF